MTYKSKNITYIILEFSAGLIFGIIGGYLYSLFDKSHITSFVFNTFLIIYISSLLGILITGFIHCHSTKSQKIFIKSALLSLVGLCSFLGLYILLDVVVLKYRSNYIANVISPILIPIIGGVVGFNIIPKQTQKRKI
jgi:LytS/YehU family sensor histidine kinase